MLIFHIRSLSCENVEKERELMKKQVRTINFVIFHVLSFFSTSCLNIQLKFCALFSFNFSVFIVLHSGFHSEKQGQELFPSTHNPRLNFNCFTLQQLNANNCCTQQSAQSSCEKHFHNKNFWALIKKKTFLCCFGSKMIFARIVGGINLSDSMKKVPAWKWKSLNLLDGDKKK